MRSRCLPNTRTHVLEFILDWVSDPSASQQNILWLYGMAGSGKSTLATTIASTFNDSGCLGAFLFFDRDVMERSDPAMVFRTLAYQLASSNPDIGEAIREVVEKNANIWILPLRLQFIRLLLEPLSTFKHLSNTIVVVLDGLDECGTARERGELLEILTTDFIHLPFCIRAIITSRADIDIYHAFSSKHHILAYELDISSPAISDDILSYFRIRMSLIRGQQRYLQLATDWPGEDTLRKLVQRASGLFVWASTASEFINGHHPIKRLDIILKGDIVSGAEVALDTLYKSALESVGLWDDDDFVSEFRAILGIVLVAYRPFSSCAIDALLHLPHDRPSMHTLSLLSCVLQQHPTVRIVHPSFRDFLMNRARCGRDIWFFDESSYHRHLAFHCLDCMDVVLKQNMCDLSLSQESWDECIPDGVSYSCVFWIDHVRVLEANDMPLVHRLRSFVFCHLLHWIETMSILKRSRDTIPLLHHLINWLSVRRKTPLVGKTTHLQLSVVAAFYR